MNHALSEGYVATVVLEITSRTVYIQERKMKRCRDGVPKNTQTREDLKK